MNIMKIAIIDMATDGHHLEYIYGLCQEILKKNDYEYDVDLYCSGKLYEYIRENSLQNLDKISNLNFIIDELKHPEGGWIKQTKTAYNNIKKLQSYSKLIFLSMNVYFPALTLHSLFQKNKIAISGIYFNPFLRGKSSYKDIIRNLSFQILNNYIKNIKIFVLNDEETVSKLNNRFNTDAFDFIEDPVPTFFYQEKSDNKKENTCVRFLMIGSLSKRKGVLEYLKAIRKSNRSNQHILAGKIDNNIKAEVIQELKFMQSEGYDIKLIDSFLSIKEFTDLIDICDVLIMPYLTKGASSGILGHASYRQKPVIGPHSGLLAEIIKNYKMGVCIDPKETNIFVSYLADSEKVNESFNSKQTKVYSEKNSYENFYKKLIE